MAPAVELRGIHKSFARVRACDAVDLTVEGGEVHALVGENGAGKSTLMKILYGIYAADQGEIRVAGELLRSRGPAEARAHGLGMVHQHFMLVRPMTVAENILLGREGAGALARLPRARAEATLRELSRRFGLDVEATARVEDLPVGVQQRAEILRLLTQGAEVLIFDEPTAVLTPREVSDFFEVLLRLKREGKTVILITHKLDEVMRVSDRVTVLRSGRVVGVRNTRETSAAELAGLMVGRDVRPGQRPPAHVPGQPVLEVRDLFVRDSRRLPAVKGVSFGVRQGEIVGVAGVEGNGQTELLEALAGLRLPESGSVHLCGRDLTRAGVRTRFEAGLAHIPEDRHKHGMVLEMTLAENVLLGRQHEAAFVRRGFLRAGSIDRVARAVLSEFDVRPADPAAPARDLSGGNQQKVVAGRELGRRPVFLVAAQPTRGLDIGATEFIHRRLVGARDAGCAVLLVSADLQEVLELSDRILVLYRGAIAGETPGAGASEELLGPWMLGGAAS